MTQIKFLCLWALVALSVASALAADVSGKWNAQMPGRDGQTREVTFNFKVDSGKLSGAMSFPQGEFPITDGKVDGDQISFTVNLEVGGNQVKLLFTGKVAGDEIKFTRKREGDDQTQEFTAKRAAS